MADLKTVITIQQYCINLFAVICYRFDIRMFKVNQCKYMPVVSWLSAEACPVLSGTSFNRNDGQLHDTCSFHHRGILDSSILVPHSLFSNLFGWLTSQANPSPTLVSVAWGV